jgi:hypothetical protein
LRANDVLVFDGRQVIARHPRIKLAAPTNLDHCLEVLPAKPDALAGPRRRRQTSPLIHQPGQCKVAL